MLVPNVVGTTVGEARSMIESAGLSVGNVTVTQRQAMLDGIIRVAWALDEMIVIAQHPDAGTLVSAVDPPPVDLEGGAGRGYPGAGEPAPVRDRPCLHRDRHGAAPWVMTEPTSIAASQPPQVAIELRRFVRPAVRRAQAARGCALARGLVLALLAISACEQPSPQQRIENAKAHLLRGNAQLAIAELKHVLQEQPDDAGVRLMLGKLYLTGGNLPYAEKELGRARTLGLIPPSSSRRWASCG